MPSSPADLMQQVADFLQGVYAGGASTPAQGSVLAFEQLGFPVSPDDFRTDRADPKSPLSPELGLYQTSKYSDFIPTIIGASTLVPSVRTLEEQYSELLGGSQAVSGADVTAFGAVKSPAREFFDNTPRPRPDGSATQYHAAEPTPTDWYDATILTNWTNHTLTTGQDPAAPSAGGASPPPTPQGPVPAPPLLVWHVLPEQPVASRSRFQFAARSVDNQAIERSPAPIEARPVETAAPLPSVGRVSRMFSPAMTSMVVSMPPQAVQPVTPEQPVAAVARPPWRALVQVYQQATPQHVQSDQMKVSFDYCFVRLSRPWLSWDFLSSRGWYLPRYYAGEWSSGDDMSGAGRFSMLPIAFIAIKQLTITANWSAADIQAAQNSVGLGSASQSFSLGGSSFDTTGNTLSCPGIQIIAWVCEAQPRLPPESDPTLPPAPAASPSTTASTSPPSSSSSSGTSSPATA